MLLKPDSQEMFLCKRKNEPAHYTLKIDSFSLLSEAGDIKIESDVFEASGHKWRLDLYPHGNSEEEEGSNHISIYLTICDYESGSKGWAISADVKFFVYDHLRHEYLTFQDSDGNRARFNENRTKCGIDKLISLESFMESGNGFLSNDSCVFGVEVFTVPMYTLNDRCLSMIKPPESMNCHMWTIYKFSAITENVLYSEVFKAGKVKWEISLYPKGNKSGKGTSLSIYLKVHDPASLPHGWRLFAKYKLRVKNQKLNVHKEEEVDGNWFDNKSCSFGYPCFMLLSELTDMENGYLLNDTVIVEAEVSLVGILKDVI